MTTVLARICPRRDTAANFTSANTLLEVGELARETDTGKIKFGDGATAWNSLAYWTAGGVTSFNTRTGAVTLSSADVTGALGYTPTTAAGAVSAVAAAATGIVKSNGTALSAAASGDITGLLGYIPFNRAGDTAARIATGGAQSAAAWTTAGLVITQPAATYTDTSSTGTVPLIAINALQAPTLAASSTATVTDLYTLFVETPVAGTNVTATNRYALGAASLKITGNALFNGSITAAGLTITGGASLASSTAGTFTLSLAGGALASGATRTINIGTAGLAGSTTNITIGSGAGTVNIYRSQQAPTSKSAAATLTAAEIAVRLLQYTGAADNLTLPTGTALDTDNAAMAVDTALDFSVVNTGSGTATMTANTGVTIVGAAGVAAGTSGLFRLRKTATATYILYRLS